ncbi:MAG: putative DNA binding domain-containing protein [Muribaculaceae bacterium]|nr:putative DNA binding domain-containing protein [Muribaculaceae bacterium]
MELKTLITECTAYDFKVMLEEKKPKSWLKSVSAFANGLGGSLFFGIDNDGIVKGLEDVQHVCEAIGCRIRDYMDPLPEVEIIPHDIDGLHILQLKVNVGHYTPYYYVGDGQRIAFVRVGDESIPATDEDMKRLVLKGTNRSYDSLRSHTLAEKSSFVILSNTFEERIGQGFQKKFIKSFGLLTEDGWLTNAGELFSDDCHLSQSRLYCTRWHGLEKDDAINDAEFKGNLLLLLREAMNFVKSNTKKGWEKLPDRRKNKSEYAERAILEALVNHFIHRDYTVMGGEVHIDIYDDRIVVTSPGGMYSGENVQDLQLDDISSERRNPILADVMAQLDYMEKRGSGLKRICNETKALDGYRDEIKPLFKSTASQFMTIIYSMEYKPTSQEEQQNGTKLGPSWDQVGMKISLSWDEVERLFIALQEPKSMSELKNLYGWSNTTKFKVKFVNPLIEKQFVGMTLPDKPTSPKQRYFLTNSGKALLTNMTYESKTNDLVQKVSNLIENLSEDEKRLALGLLQKE